MDAHMYEQPSASLCRHIVAGEFHSLAEKHQLVGRVVDPKYLDETRAGAKQFSTKLLSRKSCVALCAIRNFKNGKITSSPAPSEN